MEDKLKGKLKRLDELREEKRRYENFVTGSGDFWIQNNITLIKCFGIGQWELRIRQKESEVQDKIIKILKDRVSEIDLEINRIVKE